ncbi:MAG: hypothetical protein NUV94_05525 [Candidatus Acetothermia bacterium]|nr:hypothetical protein [Candidatus Acetothermia bacterium]
MDQRKVAELMERHGVPGRDAYDLPTSPLRFSDGAQYRMEISGVERPEVLEAIVDEAQKRKVPVHRMISTVMGATLLTREELTDFAQIASEARVEVILTPGPRSAWDTGRQLVTPEGGLSGLRFRGADQLRYVIADILRAVELGFRGFLVLDEGLLWLLSRMRDAGDLPKDVVFKVSIFAGHGNPAGAKVLEALGANTFNPLADLDLPELAAIRKTVRMPLDLHIYLTDSFGGFNRFYEAPEMVRVCSPCYFKLEPGPACVAGPGALYKPWVAGKTLADWGREKVKHAGILHELVQESLPGAVLSGWGPADLAVPKP